MAMRPRRTRNGTTQAQVEALLASGKTSAADIARRIGRSSRQDMAYVRACIHRARRFAATGKKSTPDELRRRMELKRAERWEARL